MQHWVQREELSAQNKLRRSYFEVLRDELDQYILDYALLQSHQRFVEAGLPYPFVEKRELKPRARIPQREYNAQNTFLIIFVEDVIPGIYKKHIRFFESNQTTKKNLLSTKAMPLYNQLDKNLKHFESTRFLTFLEKLLPVDYALLIQRDPATRARNRYTLTHFHVRVDWPISDAAEDLARQLRYISKDLYERGESYAEDIQKKFFEYYGVSPMAGGRRTAAIVAAQFLKRLPCITTIYVGSSETRAVIRYSERNIAKTILMKLSVAEMSQITADQGLTPANFRKNYIVAKKGKEGVALFRTTYAPTPHSLPPEDGKLRDLKSDHHWLSIEGQHLMPKPGRWKFQPIPYNVIYS